MAISTTGKISFKSLTGIVLLLGLCWALFGMRYSWIEWADSQMFRLATYLLPEPVLVNDIELISIPENLSADPESVNQLIWLISKLDKSNASAISLLLAPLPSLDYQLAESGKAKLTNDDDKWQLSKSSLSKLAQILAKHNVQLGVVASGQTDYYSVGNLSSETSDVPAVVKQLSKYLLPQAENLSIFSIDNNFPYERLPVASNRLTARQPLIWHEAESKITIPDTSLGLFARYKKSTKTIWHEEGIVELDYEQLETDISGQVMMYYSSFTGHAINASFTSLDQALKASGKRFKNKLVIIGKESDPAVLSLANNLLSLTSQSFYHVPTWAYWLSHALLLLVMLYLLKLVSRMGRNTAYVTSLLLITFILVFQYGLFITKALWMPFVSIYLYLILGHIVVLMKQHNDSSVNHLRLQAHEALWHLGQYQFEQGDHDKALYSLLKCKPTEDVLDKMYEIGLGFERRREYDKALQLYSEINIRHKSFKDVAKRLESLTNVSGSTVEMAVPGSVTKTLVMPDLGLQLPMLGRYELEKELGRGAMGVVYLGKDPKINRQVAIKTLEYNMFSDNEIKTIKSRFFREAEAAGRLSHPNIVTVYDVGDEKDFAFIAMDYAQGVPLSDYTEKEKLLPVAEVYKIIADVAETLGYAHEQNIVHRDIKPSNIMYNPETKQIKITDFGIARITDSAKTRTGSFMGSPAYMAPEQMTGSRVDGQADIYALGASFYQLLTGELPYKSDSLANLTYQITHNKHRSIRDLRADLPASATRIVNKALQKNPEKRYANGKEMAEALRKNMPKEG